MASDGWRGHLAAIHLVAIRSVGLQIAETFTQLHGYRPQTELRCCRCMQNSGQQNTAAGTTPRRNNSRTSMQHVGSQAVKQHVSTQAEYVGHAMGQQTRTEEDNAGTISW